MICWLSTVAHKFSDRACFIQMALNLRKGRSLLALVVRAAQGLGGRVMKGPFWSPGFRADVRIAQPTLLSNDVLRRHDVLHEVCFSVRIKCCIVVHAPHSHLQLLLVHPENVLHANRLVSITEHDWLAHF